MRDKMIKRFEDVKGLADELGLKISKKEVENIKEFVRIKPPPTPKIIIKDQKNPNSKDGSPMRPIVLYCF